MFKTICLSSICYLFVLQAHEARTLICGKEIFSDEEAALPSSIEEDTTRDTPKKKKKQSSQPTSKPNRDDSATTPSLLSPQADKEIFDDK